MLILYEKMPPLIVMVVADIILQCRLLDPKLDNKDKAYFLSHFSLCVYYCHSCSWGQTYKEGFWWGKGLNSVKGKNVLWRIMVSNIVTFDTSPNSRDGSLNSYMYWCSKVLSIENNWCKISSNFSWFTTWKIENRAALFHLNSW